MKFFSIIVLILLFTFPALSQNKKKKHVHHHHKHQRKNVAIKRYKRINIVFLNKRRVKKITVLPTGYKLVVHKKNNYYLHKGYYYRKINNAYHVVVSPRGLRIKTLPATHKIVVMNGLNHYYSRGTYYKKVEEEYEAVTPEAGTIIDELPEYNVDEVTIDGKSYYEYDGIIYKKLDSGKFEVVGSIED